MEPSPLQPLDTSAKHSRIPGDFDTDDDLSPTKTIYDDARSTYSRHSGHNSRVALHEQMLSSDDDPLPLGDSSELEAREMSRKLMDVESSFLPDQSPETTIHRDPQTTQSQTDDSEVQSTPAAFKRPGAQYEEQEDETETELADSGYTENMTTSMLETMSSSPTAEAAARTVSRVVSMASMGGYETAAEDRESQDEEEHGQGTDQTTPTKKQSPRSQRKEEPTTPTPLHTESDGKNEEHSMGSGQSLKSPKRRPKYLSSRFASQRSSRSSYTNTSTEEVGEYVGLQAGAGLPGATPGRPEANLSRTISLGSMASGVSGLSDGEGQSRSTSIALDLGPLPEESPLSERHFSRTNGSDEGPKTPRIAPHNISTPTDTVINQRVQDFEVPGTIARRFQDQEGSRSPERRAGAPTPSGGRVKNLTLREQSSLIDKLQKENWKLKLKLYFMDQTLAERSDESVKAMISENVELKTLKFSMTKEIRGLKRSIKELEHKLKERDETIGGLRAEAKERLITASGYTEASQELETEVTYLRERMETYEVEIEKLRTENATKEAEKRRLADLAKKSGEKQVSDVGAREEVELWKDLLEAETARKEQADEENRQLREEIWRLKEQQASSAVSGSRSQEPVSRPRSSRLHAESSNVNTRSSASSTLVEQLRHENAELRREVGAQTSMLTSRNREKERLYQEIEDLKMRYGRSDSILDRSVSRSHQRAGSPGSSQTRITQIGDAERDAFEVANGELRDALAELKLENQELARQLDGVLDELEQLGEIKSQYDELRREHDEHMQRTDEELITMQAERDEALALHEEAELSFQDLKAEAQDRINELEDELDGQTNTIKQLEEELAARDQDSESLRNEMRMTAEGLARVEADVQAKVHRIGELQHRVGELELQNEDLTQELESIEDSLNQTNSKCEKLSVELESRVSECAFLREEQDGTMLRIGDLENNLKATQTSLDSEKDKAKDLEARLEDERHQREVIGSKEKQEVQKMMNELNQDAATSKDDARKLRKLVEHREAEVKKWRTRLDELETGLKEVLGFNDSESKANYFTSITRIQRELENTKTKYDSTQHALAEKERLLQRRDALLESHGMESRKLADLLDKERSARRSDQAQRDQWEKSHQHTSRTVSQKDSRITELEQSRSSDRKRLANLENQFKDQLYERNALLLSLWSKISALCGTDWQNQNSLISGHLPSIEVVSSMLPAFSRHLLLAVKTVEAIYVGFKQRVKTIERDLNKDFQGLEHNLDLRIKRLDRLEQSVQVSKISGAANAAPEIAKLRGENRNLRSEIETLKQEVKIRNSRVSSVIIERPPLGASYSADGRLPATPQRTSSRQGAGTLVRGSSYGGTSPDKNNALAKTGKESSDMAVAVQQDTGEVNMKWMHRLRELERRLKAEREARLLDRSGASKRLKEGMEKTEQLQAELEREREKYRALQNASEGDA